MSEPAILALDLASATGFAHSDGRSGTHRFRFTAGERLGGQMMQVENWLGETFPAADLLCVEVPHFRGGPATMRLVGMFAVADLWAAKRGAKLIRVHTATLKKHATGSGRAKKPEVLRAAKERWPETEIVDDNHSDALWLLDYAQTIGA